MKPAVSPCAYGKANALPPVDPANQPLNEYPDRVGVPGEMKIPLPVVVFPEVTELPP